MKSKWHRSFFVVFITALLLSSCAQGPRFTQITPENEEAIFYFYRNYDLRTLGEWASVHLNGKPFAVLPEDSYSFARLKPGLHNIKIYKHGVVTGDKPRPYYNISFRATAGEEVYLRWSTLVGNSDNMLPSGYISRIVENTSVEHGFVHQDLGRSEIAVTKLAEPKLFGVIEGID